jgi:murein hydrolase activator
MTLYGRNQSIYVKEGEEVEAGQIIAVAGNSGGFKKNALYFEIRHNGSPLDPMKWLRK